jgi:nickel/cobalt transporter (NicO) family protein
MRSAAAHIAKAFLFAGLALLLVVTAAQAEFKPINPFAATEVAPGPPSALAPTTAAPFQAPGPLGRVFAWVFDKQQSLQRTLAMSVKSLKTNPLGGAITLAVLSFVYGVLHAVGPGHGKTIISSYVVANEETVRRGVIISFIAAGLQALTAVVLVGVLLIALGATGLQVNAWSNQLETISYAMIALVGLYLLAGQVRSAWRRWQGDRPVTVIEARDAHGHSDHHHHYAHHGHHHHGHGDHYGCARAASLANQDH